METITLILLLSLSLASPVLSSNPCSSVQCNPLYGPEIRFPFRLKDRQPSQCGYPGFDLSCNSDSQTIITLPQSGDFVVDHIDYTDQTLFINDPDRCLANRIFNFTVSGSPFRAAYSRNYTFFNCSSGFMGYSYTSNHYVPLLCVGDDRNYTIMATETKSSEQIPATCLRISSVLVPLELTAPQFYWAAMDLREDLQLVWRNPSCRECEFQGRVCGLKGSGPDIACYSPSKSGLSRGAKYGLIIGVGIPGLMCLIGLICYAGGMIRTYSLQRHQQPNLPTTIFDQRSAIRSTNGLDQPTIESYPTTVLGESRRLPKPSDGTCPICLSDYEPKETLRIIPECNHFFHSECIDEWLKSNGTCPLCRNSPKSSIGTPCSTGSLSSLVSSSSSSNTTLERD